MAVSAAALPALNAKLFEEEVGSKHCMFAYFFESLRTLVEGQALPLQREAVGAMFQCYTQRVEADLENAKKRFYASATTPEFGGSLRAYRERVGAYAHRKEASLHEIVSVYKWYIQHLANDLLPLLQSERVVYDLVVRANGMVKSRFNC